MPDPIAPRPARVVVDDTAADIGSLIAMGVVDEEPVPSIQPFLEPVFPDPPPDDAA